MIIEFFFELGTQFLEWLMPLLPRFDDLNGVVVTANTAIIPLLAGMASMGAWLPWGAITLCMSILLPLYLASFLFRIIRVLAGHIPFLGGNG